ncbi:MAG: SPOR domain-containing protein [Pyrinomonadaceae bacterium]|nr:SPOR domain-containing protein [Pyrinomonadaceae bacterium]
MRITCPKCEFKGLIDSAPLAVETHVACVRCGTTFEAMLVEGEIRTSLLPDDYEKFLAPQSAPDADAETMPLPSSPTAPDAEDVLALPQPPEVSQQPEVSAEEALENLLLVSPAEVGPMAQENVLFNQDEGVAQELAVVTEACSLPLQDETQSEKVAEAVSESSFNYSAHEEAATDYDKHGMGMRLMRISPLWLVICGMTFISVIILSNQFAKPAEQEQRIASNFASPSNKATNQTLAQPPQPANTNPAATSVQDSSQTGAPAPVELKKEAEAIEEKAETKAQEEPKPAASAPSEVETKKSEPAPLPPSQSTEAGGFTIQIGSYNVIEQANERVARLQATGFDARVVAVELPKRGTWYRVQAGRFSNREEATRFGNEMKSRGAADSFIIADAQGGK